MVLLRRLVMYLVLLLPCFHWSNGFAAGKSKSMTLVEMRRRSLMAKAKIASKTKKFKGQQQDSGQATTTTNQHLSKQYILGVLGEAIYRQKLATESLCREMERRKNEHLDAPEDATNASRPDDDSFRRVEARRDELDDISSRLLNLQSKVEQMRAQPRQDKLERIQEQISSLGFGSIFKQPESSWKTTKSIESEFGRPAGFGGDVFYSPLGVPILVGRMNAHKDEAMRSAAQGADLWFQVEDYNGSRVLLRTSLLRGLEGSRQCKQYAADLAAKYSVWGEQFDSVPVMYTDSRKVAKRGTKIGNMKKSKSLGRIMGYPQNV